MPEERGTGRWHVKQLLLTLGGSPSFQTAGAGSKCPLASTRRDAHCTGLISASGHLGLLP